MNLGCKNQGPELVNPGSSGPGLVLSPSVGGEGTDLGGSTATLSVPYRGFWDPSGGKADFVHRPKNHVALTVPLSSKQSKQSRDIPLPQHALSLFLPGHPDYSGCTGSLTPDASVLINLRPCSERFAAANGGVTRATAMSGARDD